MLYLTKNFSTNISLLQLFHYTCVRNEQVGSETVRLRNYPLNDHGHGEGFVWVQRNI